MVFHTYNRKLGLKWKSNGELKIELDVMWSEFLSKHYPLGTLQGEASDFQNFS